MLRKTLAALLLAFGVCAAQAQTSPNLKRGDVPTAAQWNSYFAAKQDTLNYTPLNRAGDGMLGLLTLKASTPGGPGLNLGVGLTPTAPADGSVWMTLSGIYYQVGGVTQGPIVAPTTYGTGVSDFLLVPSSANLSAALTDETGSGLAVFSDSPALTGNPTAPTQTLGNNSTRIASTAFVQAAVVASTGVTVGGTPIASGTNGRVLYDNSGLLGEAAPGNGVDISGGTLGLTAARRTLPTIQRFTSGSGTYTTPAGALWIEVLMVGGGAGGAGGGTGTPAGTNGGNTCWNTTGAACTTPVSQAAGGTSPLTGGAASGTCNVISLSGGSGGSGNPSLAGTLGGTGGTGGTSSLGGNGAGIYTGAGVAATTNSGSGGGGGGNNATATTTSGQGGGAGATCRFIINSPAATYTYAVGTAGSAGGAGANGFNGAVGGAGLIVVWEHYGS